MSKRAVMKKVQVIDYNAINQQLGNLRRRIKLAPKDKTSQDWYEFVKTRNYTYKPTLKDADDISHRDVEIGDPYLISLSLEDIEGERYLKSTTPEFMRSLVMFLKTSVSIDFNETDSIEIKIYPPARKISSFMNEIPFAKMLIGHRFLIPIGSNEHITYNMMDMSAMKSIIGLSVPEENFSVPESIERSHAYYFDQMTAISLTIKYNDEEFYVSHKLNRRAISERKLPLNRHMLVIDFKSKGQAVRDKLTDHVRQLREMSTKGGKRGEMAAKSLVEINSRLKEETGEELEELKSPETKEVQEEKVEQSIEEPLISEIKENESSEAKEEKKVFSEESDDEFEDISIPSRAEDEEFTPREKEIKSLSSGIKDLF